MSDPNPMSDAKMWVRHAHEDLEAGRLLLREETGSPRQSAWFAQQAAEKALKALLIAEQRSFPYTHDLEHLTDLLSEEGYARYGDLDVEPLSTYAVDTRYPGMPKADAEDARAALQVAEQIVEAVLDDLDV
jgi:HEPN domain-containing protein